MDILTDIHTHTWHDEYMKYITQKLPHISMQSIKINTNECSVNIQFCIFLSKWCHYYSRWLTGYFGWIIKKIVTTSVPHFFCCFRLFVCLLVDYKCTNLHFIIQHDAFSNLDSSAYVYMNIHPFPSLSSFAIQFISITHGCPLSSGFEIDL